MWRLNYSLSRLFEVLLTPLQSLPPFWVLLILSGPTAALMLLVFRYASDQEGIREAKDRIKAHLLEILLFKDDLGIQLSVLKDILAQNMKYLRLSFKPMLVAVLPLAAIVIHLDTWFGYRPLRAGEAVVLSVKSSEEKAVNLSEITLAATEGVTIETPPLRIPELREVDWRIRGDEAGLRVLTILIRGTPVEKTVRVSERLGRVSRHRVAPGFWDLLLNPAERPLPKSSGLDRVSVHYPSRSITLSGWNVHWIAVFIVLSVAFGFALKGFFKVEI